MLARPLTPSPRKPRRGFTLVELLVVIGIIVVLIGILIPVVGKVRTSANTAATRNFMNQLGAAIDRYQEQFHAYPGPFGNNDVYYTGFAGGPTYTAGVKNIAAAGSGFDTATLDMTKITMSENLVLGLLGGLHADTSTPTQLDYDPATIGSGPTSLSTIGLPTRYPPLFDAKQLSWRTDSVGQTGQYQDDAAAANDSIIPEFVDNYGYPMPILYMRAKVGANPPSTSDAINPIVTHDLTETQSPPRPGQYDISQINGYTTPNATTGLSIGVGKSGSKTHGLQMATWTAPSYPTLTGTTYDAYPYLLGSSGQVRQKDGYILISAGPDRVYGTSDDICNFGTVGQ